MILRLIWSLPLAALVGVVIACEGEALKPPCPSDVPNLGGQCFPEQKIRVNSVGYSAMRTKRAVAYVAGAYQIKTVDGERVLDGRTLESVVSMDTGETLHPIDFSELQVNGTYYIELESGERSPEFEIGQDALESAFTATMLGLYGLRCGEEVEINWKNSDGASYTFSHEACHLAPASLELVGSGTKDDTGGWHDAGDYGKYTVNSAFSVAFLLKAYEHFPTRARELRLSIPEQGGKLPDLLDEAKVELEWLLKVQMPSGAFAHKVTAKKFEGTILPERDSSARFFSPVGSAATGGAGAVLALAARLFRELDPDFSEACLNAAERAEEYLAAHPELEVPDLEEFSTGAYLAGDGDADERLWIVSELFEATGEAKYLSAFEARLHEVTLGRDQEPRVQAYFDWYGTTNLAYDTYLRSQRPGRNAELTQAVADAFVRAGDEVAAHSAADPYGRGSSNYSWGSNGAVARLALTLSGAYFAEPKPAYLDAGGAQLDYLFGRNPFGRSFLTGVGYAPASAPHHRPSTADSVIPPWPGLLVGGPHSGGTEPDVSEPALKWHDDKDDYNHNEIAINWNTALAYALVFSLGAEEGGAGCPTLGAGGACGDTAQPALGGEGGFAGHSGSAGSGAGQK